MAKVSTWSGQANNIGQYLFIFFAFCIPIALSLENIGFVLTLLCALFSGSWWYSRRLLLKSTFNWWLLLLFLLFAIGLFYTQASYSWRFRIFKKESEIIAILFLLPMVALDRSFFLQVIKGYVIGCIIVALIAWLGYFHCLPDVSWFQHPAPYYVFFKIYAALFMAFGAYLTLILLKLNWHNLTRWLWLMIFILLSYNVLWQSLSRTGYIIYVILMLVFIWQTFRFKAKIAITIMVAAAILAVWFFSSNFHIGLESALHNVNKPGTSAGIRHEYLRNSLTLWQRKPIWGYGTGGFRRADIAIRGVNAGGEFTTIAHAQATPENTYYRILVEQGIVGLLALLLLWGWQCIAAFRLTEPIARQVAIAFMLVMLVASMSQDLLLDGSPRLFYVLFSTLLYAPLIMGERKKT